MATTEELHALVQQQADEIRTLRDELAELRAEVGHNRRPTDGSGVRDATPPVGDEGADREASGSTGRPFGGEVADRREVLRHAGAVAAGAAVGGAAVVLGTASPAAAAPGSFDGNPAVTATATTGIAVLASSSGGSMPTVDARNSAGGAVGIGVYGQSAGSGKGVYGSSPSGSGVFGQTSGGSGVEGFADGGYPVKLTAVVENEIARRPKSHLRFATMTTDPGPGMPVPTTRSDGHVAGELVFADDGALWICTADGTPGAWTRLGGGSASGALTLLDAPVRVYDSRPNNPPNIGTKTKLANGETRVIDTKANSSGVPAGATGVLTNLTVVNTSASGFLAAFRAGIPVPNASTINWFTTGEIVANTTVVACDTTAQIALYVPPTSSTDVLVDVIGYYR